MAENDLYGGSFFALSYLHLAMACHAIMGVNENCETTDKNKERKCIY